MLTQEQFKQVLPQQIRGNVTDAVMDTINNALADSEFSEGIKNNLLTYTGVMQNGHYRLTDYLNAVSYVSYKLMGMTNTEAWKRTFVERYNRLQEQGKSNKDLSAHVSMYNKSKLVNEIWAQTLIPAHIINADAFQQAINHQVKLMTSAKSEMVQMQAANSLMSHLKAPAAQKVEIDVGYKEDSMLTDMKNTIKELAAKQHEMIKSGAMTVQEVLDQEIIQVERDPEDDVFK